MESGSGGIGVGIVATGTAASSSWPPFLGKTYDMVDDPATDAVVSWSKSNDSFIVWNVPEFSRDLLPKYFKHSNFSSFVRQLNTYGFRKIDPDRQEFANEWFIRGHKHLLKSIYRRKTSQVQNPSVSIDTDDGKLGMDEEVETLKKGKNILMQELVRLRQQQQTTENKLQNVGQRVHLMEHRQKQMMSFLAKAMQSPGFVTQLMQQQNETNLHISGGNKKRRIPSQSEEILPQNLCVASSDGQIVKYKPLMNEAALAMSSQILNMSPPNRLESKFINANGFLIGTGSPPSVSDASSSADRMSLVALSDVNSNTTVRTELSSSTGLLNKELAEMLFSRTSGVQDMSRVGPVTLQKNIGGVESSYLEQVDTSSSFSDAPIPAASDEVMVDDDVDATVNDDRALPGIHDVFWEQFLPGNGHTDDQENTEHQEVVWGKLKSLNNLTEQMALLATASNSG